MSFPHPWRTPPTDLTLPDGQIHVWRAWLNLPAAQVGQLRAFLTEQERLRADRFHFPEHRRHFTIARATLRVLLGRYLRESPEKIHLAYNRYGKPRLDSSPIEFNLSHSGEMALYAFARDREIGVDIEWTERDMEDREQLAERFFSPREAAALLALPASLGKEAFFHCWTRKEAYIKARGKGLSIPLDQFEVTFEPGVPARLVATRDEARDATGWFMETLTPGDDYIAALVAEGPRCEIEYWQVRSR